MRVLMISGDRNVVREGTAAHRRFMLQKTQTEELVAYVRESGESKFAAARRMVREGGKGRWDVVTAQDPFFLGHIAWHIAKRTGAKLQLQIHTDIFSSSFATQSLGNRLKIRCATFHLRR